MDLLHAYKIIVSHRERTFLLTVQRQKWALWFYSGWNGMLVGWQDPCASMVSYASWSVQLGSTHTLSLGSEVSAGHWQGSRAKDIFGHLITLKFDYVYVWIYVRLMIQTNIVYWQFFFRLIVRKGSNKWSFSSLWNNVEQIRKILKTARKRR